MKNNLKKKSVFAKLSQTDAVREASEARDQGVHGKYSARANERSDKEMRRMGKFLVLPDIRSTYNVGAIFRTADAVGISHIYLVGTTPTPLDRFGRVRKDIAKTALGAEKTVAWTYIKTILPLISKLKKEGFEIIAIEQAENSVDYKKVKVGKRAAFILGSETDGLPKNILKKCNVVAEITMHGEKESLNVSVATGVALFRMLDK